MPNATMPIKILINCHFNTFFRIIISGSERAITDIIKAKAVPIDTPCSKVGKTPASRLTALNEV